MGFRNDNLALFNKNTWHWGSIQYNPEEKSFEENIPFIWDVLEFSRLKEQVFVGIHHVDPIRYNHPYFHWDEDFGDMFTIPTIRIPISKAYNLKYYNYMKNEYINLFDQNVFRYIQEKIESTHTPEERKQIIKEYIKTAYNVSDFYFEESFKKETNSNNGTIVDDINFEDYQRKLGKVKKINDNNSVQ